MRHPTMLLVAALVCTACGRGDREVASTSAVGADPGLATHLAPVPIDSIELGPQTQPAAVATSSGGEVTSRKTPKPDAVGGLVGGVLGGPMGSDIDAERRRRPR